MKKLFALLFVAALFTVQAYADEITLAPGQKQTLRLDEAYYSSKHDDKGVAHTSGVRSRDVTFHGKREGESHVQLFAKNGGLIREFDVYVQKAGSAGQATKTEKTTAVAFTPVGAYSGDRAVRIPSRLVPEHRAVKPSDSWGPLRNLFPKEAIVPQVVGNSLVLRGTVSDATTAAQIMQVAEQFAGGKRVINLMQVKTGQQVMLRVRIGEVQRGAMDQLGLSAQGVVGAVSGLFYSNTLYDVDTRLDYLSQNGLMKTLAEPNLTAISGETATFLAGGEFPIPVPQKGGDVFTVEYKEFGVGIEFTPTVLAQNRIRLAVEPEVSELSGTSVKFGGAKIPGISTRRAKTTVELAPGESFMIAGLINDSMKTVSDEMPGLGDIPILGALFRSTAFKRNETELVIAVTPYLVDPVTNQDIKLPTDHLKPASVLEQYFMGAIAHQPNILSTSSVDEAPQLGGKYGFMTE